ncbi:unnamed protein product [Protopolystoma xenopodis]|uniref:Uncharacterized protein n=1 Tax=Protopolystoma xenopodis TaxID=117903 RepID=A0A3S4ZWI5_9PLAT|nr:unnamed protein product [Protopolystoma xenopodis]
MFVFCVALPLGKAVGPVWIIHGCRSAATSLLFPEDLASALRIGVLTHLCLAFSRSSFTTVPHFCKDSHPSDQHLNVGCLASNIHSDNLDHAAKSRGLASSFQLGHKLPVWRAACASSSSSVHGLSDTLLELACFPPAARYVQHCILPNSYKTEDCNPIGNTAE